MINKENAHWMFSKKILENIIIIAGKMCTIMLHNNGFNIGKSLRERERDEFIIYN